MTGRRCVDPILSRALQIRSGKAALDDGAVEQALGQRGSQQAVDVAATRRFTKHRHALGIATKFGDVVLHPLQSGDHIEHREVTGCIQRIDRCFTYCGMAEPSQNPKAVMDGHHDDALLLHKGRAVIGNRRADGVAASVNEEHHGKLCASLNTRRRKHI